jgi:hypothetical protein
MKGHTLEQQGRRDEAAATYARLLARFPADERPDIDKAVAWARARHRGITAKP